MPSPSWEAGVQEALDRARVELRACGHHAKRIGVYIAPYFANLGSASLTFNAGLCAGQGVAYAASISCATPLLAPSLGVLTVGASAAAAGQAAIQAQRVVHRQPVNWAQVRWEHLVVDAAIGIIFFKVLGGRFRQVMPSNLAHPGAFASQSILAPGARYCSSAQKNELRRMFLRDGCHTCGVRKGRVIGDHQPPNKVVFGSSEAAQASKQVRPEAELTRGALKSATSKAAGSLAGGAPPSEAIKPILSMMRVAFRNLPAELQVAKGVTQRFFPQCQGCSNKQAQLMKNLDRFRFFAMAGAFAGMHHHDASAMPPLDGRKGRLRGGYSTQQQQQDLQQLHHCLESLRSLESLIYSDFRMGKLSYKDAIAALNNVKRQKAEAKASMKEIKRSVRVSAN